MKSAHSTRAVILLALGIVVVTGICYLFEGYQRFLDHRPRPVPSLQFVLANASHVFLSYNTGKSATIWVGGQGAVKVPQMHPLHPEAESIQWLRQVSQVSQGEPPPGKYNVEVHIRYEGMNIHDRSAFFHYCPQTGVLRDNRPPTYWCRMPQAFRDEVSRAIHEDKTTVKSQP